MLSLSPAKLLVILLVALIVLGPEKLPQVARQLGAAWHDLRKFRSRIEQEVRGTFPNLPPTHEVAQAVRSPFAFLDRLADEHEKAAVETTRSESSDPDGRPPPGAAGGVGGPTDGPAGNGPAANGSRADGPGGGASGSGAVGATAATPGADAEGSSPARRAGQAGAGRATGGGPVVPDDPSMN